MIKLTKEKIESRINSNIKLQNHYFVSNIEKFVLEDENKFLKELLKDLYTE